MNRARLQAASDHIAKRLRGGMEPSAIIGELVRDFGANQRQRSGAYILSLAGISASCTWSPDKGLLDRWRRNATLRLMETA